MEQEVFARRGVVILSAIELWERFSYWTILTQLPVLLIGSPDRGGLGWPQAEALRFVGVYIGILLFSPFPGAWLMDRVLSARSALTLGAFIMGISLCLLASLHYVPAIMRTWSDRPAGVVTFVFYAALALMAAGNAIYKPIISALVGRLPHSDAASTDTAFTTFFVSIALGAVFGTVVGGYLADRFGWATALWTAGFGMFVAVAIVQTKARPYILPLRSIRAAPEQLPGVPSPTRWTFLIPVAMVLLTAIVYIAADYQVIGSVEVFAKTHVDRSIHHFTVPVTWIVAFNPLMILVFAPILNAWRRRDGRYALRLSTSVSFAIGLFLIALAFALLVVSAMQARQSMLVSPLWLIAACTLVAAGDLFVGAVTFAAISKFSPPRWQAIGMGALSAAYGLGAVLSGAIGALTATKGETTIFLLIGLVVLASAGALCGIRGYMAQFEGVTIASPHLPQVPTFEGNR